MTGAASPGGRALRCPRCRTEPLAALEGRRQAYCARCRGVFTERDALATALGLGADHPLLVEARLRATVTSAACPACGLPLARVRLGAGDAARFDACERCGGAWVDGGDVASLPGRLAALAATSPPAPRPPLGGDADDEEHGPLRLPFHGPVLDAAALPAAFALAGLLVATGLRPLAEVFVNMPLHELGHAAIAWFSGHLAIPLPFVTLTIAGEQSTGVVVLLFAALAAMTVAGVRSKRRYLVALGVAGLAVQLALTGPFARRFSGVWMSGSGVAGEYVWSTLLLVSFHYRLPDRVRWDVWRWPALGAGAFGLTAVLARWLGDVPDLAAGCSTRAGVHASSDMHVLMDDYGIAPERLRAGYHALGAACVAVVAAHYAVFVVRSRRRAGERAA
jgi:Zn-finger nucleic acid-binding protein